VCTLLGLACATSPAALVPGTYRDASGMQRIVVDDGGALHFSLCAGPSGRCDRLYRRDLAYALRADGSIVPFIGAPDGDPGPIDRYEWVWDGRAITRFDFDGGNPVRFEHK